MDRTEIEAKIKGRISDIMDIDICKVELTDNLTDHLGMDELDCADLLMSLESAFSISIPDEEDGNLLTVKDCVDYIERQVG